MRMMIGAKKALVAFIVKDIDHRYAGEFVYKNVVILNNTVTRLGNKPAGITKRLRCAPYLINNFRRVLYRQGILVKMCTFSSNHIQKNAIVRSIITSVLVMRPVL